MIFGLAGNKWSVGSSHLYQQQNDDEVANICEEQTNEIDDHYRKATHSNPERSLIRYQNQLGTQLDLSSLHRADIVHAMGRCLCRKRDYSQALETFLQAKELLENYA
jgi:tetratricopeptide (TPR) repeat protein